MALEDPWAAAPKKNGLVDPFSASSGPEPEPERKAPPTTFGRISREEKHRYPDAKTASAPELAASLPWQPAKMAWEMAAGIPVGAWNIGAVYPHIAGEYIGGDYAGAKKVAQNRLVSIPEPPGGPSLMARGIGTAAEFAQSRSPFPKTTGAALQVAGDVMGVMGGRALLPPKGVLGRVAPGAVAAYKEAFPPPAARAGELLERSNKLLLPEDNPSAAWERSATEQAAVSQAAAKARFGVEQFPERNSPFLGRQTLAAERSGSPEVSVSEAARAEKATEAMDAGVSRSLGAEINPGAAEFVRRKMGAADTARTEWVKQIQGEVDSALAKAEAAVPEGNKLDPFPAGMALVDRIRGNADEGVGAKAVKAVFNEKYREFDAAKSVAGTGKFFKELQAAKPSVVEAGTVLDGYVDLEGKIVKRLGDEPAATDAKPVPAALPETLTLRQWRGLKGEFAGLRNRAYGTPSSVVYDRLLKAAQAGEDAAANALGAEGAARYAEVRKAYKDMYIVPFKKDYAGKLTDFGKYFGDAAIPAARVMDDLLGRQNANSLMVALGAEEATRLGRTIPGMDPAALASLGKTKARAVVEPYLYGMLSEAYKNAGGGTKGVKAVVNKIRALDADSTLTAYGFDFDSLHKASKVYDESASRLTGAKASLAADTVGEVLKVDPYKVGRFVLSSDAPATAYRNLMSVSKDPAYSNSVKTLVVEELKARAKSGEDVFTDAKTRSLVRDIWTPEQVDTLKLYVENVNRMAKAPLKADSPELSAHGLTEAHKALKMASLGFAGASLWTAKGVANILMAFGKSAADSAAMSVLDDALTNPVVAAEANAALKGHRASIEKLRRRIDKERVVLGRASVGKTLGGKAVVVGGKVAVAASPGTVSAGVGESGNGVAPIGNTAPIDNTAPTGY